MVSLLIILIWLREPGHWSSLCAHIRRGMAECWMKTHDAGKGCSARNLRVTEVFSRLFTPALVLDDIEGHLLTFLQPRIPDRSTAET
jgi:hypothetical protein